MAIYPNFVGQSDERRSRIFNTERTINFYLEKGTRATKSGSVLLPTPGLVPFCYLSGPIRAMFAEDGQCFAVSGAGLYEIFPNHTAVLRGAVALDSRPATISSNIAEPGDPTRQLFITSGFLGYIYDLDTQVLTQITDPEFPARVLQGLFFDGYFIALDDANTFWLSALGDGTSWNGLDYGENSQTSDRTIGIFKANDNLFLFGSKTTAPWYNSGAGNFPFIPAPGSIMRQGAASAFSAVEIDNSLMWLGRNADGQGIVWRASGFTPIRVSHEGIEALLRQPGANLDRSVAFPYQQGGHLFYWLYVPGLETSPVYDVNTQEWHERAEWDSAHGIWLPHRARAHAFAFNKNLVGDRLSGGIYELSLEHYEDEVYIATP